MRHYYVAFALLLLFNSTFANTASQPIVCSQEYALCTSAPCVPDPRHPGYALCSCVVEKGESVGYKTCQQRAPQTNQFKVKQLLSTFSFTQFSTKKSMNCALGLPWTNCVDSPCTVDPMDNSKALCSCPIEHHQAFFTFGGECNTTTCASGFWSGATQASGILLRNALLKKTENPAIANQSQCMANHE